MLPELLVSSLLVIATVLIHNFGLYGLERVWPPEARLRADAGKGHGPGWKLLYPPVLVLGLIVVHAAEIWLYAVVLLHLEAVASMRDGIYYSTISYAAIGYSDAAIAPQWALVGALEGINGLILLGWSTAFFVSMIGRRRDD